MRKASPVIRRQGAKPPEFVATKAAFANPLMPGVRGHNKTAKATAAVLAYAGLLSLPMRLPGQKQPKATNLYELCRITDRDLRKFVPQWEWMESMHPAIRGRVGHHGSMHCYNPSYSERCRSHNPFS